MYIHSYMGDLLHSIRDTYILTLTKITDHCRGGCRICEREGQNTPPQPDLHINNIYITVIKFYSPLIKRISQQCPLKVTWHELYYYTTFMLSSPSSSYSSRGISGMFRLRETGCDGHVPVRNTATYYVSNHVHKDFQLTTGNHRTRLYSENSFPTR